MSKLMVSRLKSRDFGKYIAEFSVFSLPEGMVPAKDLPRGLVEG
jgi:hypothetical protein